MRTTFLFLSAILLTLNACQTDSRESTENESQEVNTDKDTPVKLIEYLVGEWQLERPTGDREANNEGAVLGERLTFTTEARYIVHEGNQKVDSGAYRMNEQLTNLYLESEATETPREFELELEPDVLTLKPNSTSEQNGLEYVYRRVGPASVPPDKSAEGDETETQ